MYVCILAMCVLSFIVIRQWQHANCVLQVNIAGTCPTILLAHYYCNSYVALVAVVVVPCLNLFMSVQFNVKYIGMRVGILCYCRTSY